MKRYWGFRISTGAEERKYLADELDKGNLRQGWGYEDSQNLNNPSVQGAARRNFPIKKKVKKGDILLVPEIKGYGTVAIVEAAEDFDVGYRFDRNNKFGDFGHIFPVNKCKNWFVRDNSLVGGDLRSTLRTPMRFWNIDHCAENIEKLGLIVDYRGLISKLDAAMEVYSGAGLENYDSADIKGVVVDVMACVARLCETYSQLWDIFAPVKNRKDTEEIEIFLADTEARAKFYDALCAFGRAFTMVMNSVKAFAAFKRKEIEMFRDTFVFFSKIRRSVKIRYADALDNSEYEPQMRNLLDTYMSVKDVQQIYEPIDIMNIGDFDNVVDKLPSDRSKADAIVSHLTKRIKLNRDEDPAFYDSFSKRINAVLEEFKNRILSEKEYLKQMFEVLGDFRRGDTKQKFPEKIAGDLDAQAFYGVTMPVLSEKYNMDSETIATVSQKITQIVRTHDTVDWKTNIDIHNRIRQDIDDLFYELENDKGFAVDFDDIDKITESVLNVAMRRF